MSHAIAVLIAPADALRDAASRLPTARVAALPDGFGLLPLTADVLDEIGDAGSGEAGGGLYSLTPGVARLARELSHRAPVAYVETDYFGGSGDQGAAAWVDGAQVLLPERARNGVVNRALRRIGVVARGGGDEFEAIGLHCHRRTDDWHDAAGEQG